jgi:hypothetical protein
MHTHVHVVMPDNPKSSLDLARSLQSTIRSHLCRKRACRRSNFERGWCYDDIILDIDDNWYYAPDFRKRKTNRINAWCLRPKSEEEKTKEIYLSILKEGTVVKIDDFLEHDIESILKVRGNAIWLPGGIKLGVISRNDDDNLPNYKDAPKTKGKGEMSVEELDLVEFENASEMQRDYLTSRVNFIKRILEEYRGHIAIKCTLASCDD